MRYPSPAQTPPVRLGSRDLARFGSTFEVAIEMVAAAVVPSSRAKNDSPARLERAVQRNHSVGCAAIFMVADVGAIEVEVAIWLITGLSINGQPACNLPVDTTTGSHFAIGKHGMIQFGNPVLATEIITHTDIS